MKQLLYATTNDYKVLAATTALKGCGIELYRMPTDTPDIAEIQSYSQAEVALHKARGYFALLERPLIAMDFGLFIDGLKGFPGVYTKQAIETIGEDGLLALVRDLEDRRAYTERTIVYTDGRAEKIFASRCPGSIVLKKRGDNGRNYDFIFQVDATGKTLAEMTETEKAAVNGGSWRELGKWLVQEGARKLSYKV